MPAWLERARQISEAIDEMYDQKKDFEEPFQRMLAAPDDLGGTEEKVMRRIREYGGPRWVCSYCGSTQPPMDYQCRECGAAREEAPRPTSRKGGTPFSPPG
jgi:rubrerythrin